ncbi:hypothetical protein [uncultured Mediterranean phage]|nr:hypothetical protein [uncultured Mediterranean phage]
MKIIAIILIGLASCSNITTSLKNDNQPITIKDWKEYKEQCYLDSTMVVLPSNSGTLINNEIVFDMDTTWTHKQPTWSDFIKTLENE